VLAHQVAEDVDSGPGDPGLGLQAAAERCWTRRSPPERTEPWPRAGGPGTKPDPACAMSCAPDRPVKPGCSAANLAGRSVLPPRFPPGRPTAGTALHPSAGTRGEAKVPPPSALQRRGPLASRAASAKQCAARPNVEVVCMCRGRFSAGRVLLNHPALQSYELGRLLPSLPAQGGRSYHVGAGLPCSPGTEQARWGDDRRQSSSTTSASKVRLLAEIAPPQAGCVGACKGGPGHGTSPARRVGRCPAVGLTDGSQRIERSRS
jgi:hypothetical protein